LSTGVGVVSGSTGPEVTESSSSLSEPDASASGTVGVDGGPDEQALFVLDGSLFGVGRTQSGQDPIWVMLADVTNVDELGAPGPAGPTVEISVRDGMVLRATFPQRFCDTFIDALLADASAPPVAPDPVPVAEPASEPAVAPAPGSSAVAPSPVPGANPFAPVAPSPAPAPAPIAPAPEPTAVAPAPEPTAVAPAPAPAPIAPAPEPAPIAPAPEPTPVAEPATPIAGTSPAFTPAPDGPVVAQPTVSPPAQDTVFAPTQPAVFPPSQTEPIADPAFSPAAAAPVPGPVSDPTAFPAAEGPGALPSDPSLPAWLQDPSEQVAAAGATALDASSALIIQNVTYLGGHPTIKRRRKKCIGTLTRTAVELSGRGTSLEIPWTDVVSVEAQNADEARFRISTRIQSESTALVIQLRDGATVLLEAHDCPKVPLKGAVAQLVDGLGVVVV
jgi:hypothetical protein